MGELEIIIFVGQKQRFFFNWNIDCFKFRQYYNKYTHDNKNSSPNNPYNIVAQLFFTKHINRKKT